MAQDQPLVVVAHFQPGDLVGFLAVQRHLSDRRRRADEGLAQDMAPEAVFRGLPQLAIDPLRDVAIGAGAAGGAEESLEMGVWKMVSASGGAA